MAAILERIRVEVILYQQGFQQVGIGHRRFTLYSRIATDCNSSKTQSLKKLELS